MNVLSPIIQIFKTPELRRKLLITLALLAVFRFVAHVPAPGVDRVKLRELFASSELLGVLDVFSGGTLANFSIMALGVNPYINASIIFQMLIMVVPSLEALSKEGEYGRDRINMMTRFLTVPLALVQSFGMIALLRGQGILLSSHPLEIIGMVTTIVAGSILLMWLGELVTRYGIGNGISVVIFAGIIGRLPVVFLQTASVIETLTAQALVVFGVLSVAVVAGVITVDEATRKLAVHYARRVRGSTVIGGQSTHLPLRLNHAGVIPIIFAVSLVLLPGLLGRFLSGFPNPLVSSLAASFSTLFVPDSLVYNATYFVLVVGFTYFYTAVVFDPAKVADEIRKHGGFLPGIRPGKPTADYLSYILSRITLAGALFLGVIALLPSVAQRATGISQLTIGGTGILIVVSVILEITKQLQASIVTRSYDRYA